jgi:hypothetical protein
LPAMLPPSCRHRLHRRRHLHCRTLHPFLCLRRCRRHRRHRRHRRGSRRAAATALPPSRCAALPSPPRHRQAAADVALSRCRHRRCIPLASQYKRHIKNSEHYKSQK